MTPVIVDRSQHVISRQKILPEALKVLYRLSEAGHIAYLAGGGVRDLLLHRQPKDFDIATDAHPNQVKRLFRNCRLIGRRFRLAHVFFPNVIIEVSTFRAHITKETPVAHGHHVTSSEGVVVRDNVFGTPPEDAVRRDFTVNALFYNIADRSVIDYVDGLKDLDARLLRVIGDPHVRFTEDPVRMIRAVRFAATLDFTIEPSALKAIRDLRGNLSLASRDRLYDEMPKLCFCGRAEKVFEGLQSTGLFDVIFPEIGAWLKSPAGADGQAWLMKAARQLDIWKKAGLIPSEPLLWALLFGAFHEFKAEERIRAGEHPIAALDQAVSDALMNPSNHVLIPRNVVRNAAQILAVQSSFERTQGNRPERFSRRHCFTDAFVYFKFSAGLKNRNREWLEWWKKFLAHR